MDTKILGRVRPVSHVKQPIEKTAIEKTAVEKHSIEEAGVDKTAGVLSSAPEYKKSLEKAIQLNPKLASYPREKLEQYFKIIVEFSPRGAKNPIIVANYLGYLVDAGGL